MYIIALIPPGTIERAWLYDTYSNLEVWLMDMYDFIVSKIATRRKKSEFDMEDVIRMIEWYGYIDFDFELLKERALDALNSSTGNFQTVRENFNYLAHR